MTLVGSSEGYLDTAWPDGTTALERVVEAAKRMEEHEEVDRWEFSDDVRDAVGEEWDVAPETVSGAGGNQHQNSGFYAAIDKVSVALYDAGIVSLGRSSIAGAYQTAKAWPIEERIEEATYWAHHELRGRDYDGRRSKVLRRLVAQNKRGRVGPKEVRLWKSAQRPAVVSSFLDAVEKAVRSALIRKAGPWNTIGDDDSDAIVRMLRGIADEVARGEFARKT